MNKFKRYLERRGYPHLQYNIAILLQDYNNQKHKMHVMQASNVYNGKHTGSKSKKKLLALIPHNISSFNKYLGKYTNRNGYIV